MAARHRKHHMKHHKASGGKIEHAGGNPEVIKEAEEKKKGGKVHHMKMHGHHGKHRLDRPGRKRGGRVGADLSPLSSAKRDSKADAEPKSQVGGASPD